MNNLILIGFKSAGKTTLGLSIASKLNRSFIDTDDFFEEPPHVLYKRLGETWFRQQERGYLRKLTHLSGSVIATGGGIVSDTTHGDLLRKLGTVVHLHTAKEIVKQRIFASQLPAFLNGPDAEAQFEFLYHHRLGIYRLIAHHSIINEDELWEVIRLDPFSESPLGGNRMVLQ